MKALLLIAGVASAMQLTASSFTADEASIPQSLRYLLDLRIGYSRYELYTFDLESMHDSVTNNLPDASLTLTLGSNSWDLVLNEKELRAEALVVGSPSTYDGHIYGEADQKVRFYISPILLRGKIFDGYDMHRIIPIEEYGPEFSGLAGVHVYTYMNEEPYSYSPEPEDCEHPILELGIDADYSFFVSQGADEAVVIARIMSVMNEIHEIYEENFSLDIRVVGPYIRTVQPIPDLLVLPISNIQLLLTNVWEFQRPCLSVDAAFLFSGKNLGGGGHATGGGCYNGDLYPVGVVDVHQPFILAGIIPGWFRAIVHEIGHILGADEEENTACASDCNSQSCMPPVMCQTGCEDSANPISFSSCARADIQTTINAKCNNCYSEPDPPAECAACVETYRITSSKSTPLIAECEYHNEIEITFQFVNDCDPEEIQFGFTFNPDVVEITNIGDFDEVVSPFPPNNELDYIVIDPYDFEGEEIRTFSFKAALIGTQQQQGTGSTTFTLRRNGAIITPSISGSTFISVPYVHTLNVDEPQDLSDLISTGGPPFITSANTDGCLETNPPIQIEEVLYIDIDFCLNNTVVVMLPGSKIVVNSGVIFTLDACNVFGCDEMWEHIYLEQGAFLGVANTTIEDAERAIEMYEGAQIWVRNSSFDNNYIGIYAPPGYPDRSVIVTQDVHFKQSTDLKPPYDGTQSLTGIYLNDVHGALIYGGLPSPSFPPSIPSQRVTFSDHLSGMILNNSDALVIGSRFERTHLGVFASNKANIVSIGASAFDDCQIGVRVNGMSFNAAANNFNNVHTGIELPYGNSDVSILNNYIDARSRGIRLAYPFEINGTIGNNTVSVSQSNGVGIEGISCNGDLDILTNRVFVDGGRSGISFLRSQGVEITSSNEVMIYSTDGNEPRGIEIIDCRESTVACNVIIGDNIEEDTWGLYVQDSPDMLYSCNSTNNLGHHTQFFGLCSNTDYRGADLGLGYAGLELGSEVAGSEAIIGVQDHRGNMWEDSYEWKGAWHFSSEPLVVQASEFITRTGTSLNPPNISELVNLGWFDNTNDGPATFECNEQIDCESELIHIHNEDIKLLDSIEFAEYSDIKNWLKERQVFRRLDNGLVNPSSHQSFASFYSEKGSTNIGGQVRVDRGIRGSLRISGQDSTDRISYVATRSDLLDSLFSLGSLLIDADSAQSIAVRGDIQEVIEELGLLHDSESDWVNSHAESLADDLADIDEENSKIDPTSDSEEYDQTVNTILFSSFDDGKLEISPTDSTTLRSIAAQCAFEGGPGVYHARALYSLLDTLIFDDYDICGTVSPRSPGKSKSKGASGLSLTPNPAGNHVSIEMGMESLPCNIQIVSSTGSYIQSFRVFSPTTIFNTESLQAGTYFLIASNEVELIDVQKLILVKH